MSDTTEAKKAWRKLMKEAFALIEPAARRRLDAVLAERVRELVFQSGVRLILGYAAMPDEPDLSPFFRRWVAEGGLLALPVWMGGERMLYRRVSDWETQLRPGRAGIMEPMDGLPGVGPAELELVVVPGRAFSEDCARLGRGAGCYDALFRETKAARMGAAYDFQVFPEIATDAGDVPLDMVVTPARIVGKGYTVNGEVVDSRSRIVLRRDGRRRHPGRPGGAGAVHRQSGRPAPRLRRGGA